MKSTLTDGYLYSEAIVSRRESEAQQPNGHRFGAVHCPKCRAAIDVVSVSPKLEDEFSVRCQRCETRSFHRRSVVAASSAANKIEASAGR